MENYRVHVKVEIYDTSTASSIENPVDIEYQINSISLPKSISIEKGNPLFINLDGKKIDLGNISNVIAGVSGKNDSPTLIETELRCNALRRQDSGLERAIKEGIISGKIIKD